VRLSLPTRPYHSYSWSVFSSLSPPLLSSHHYRHPQAPPAPSPPPYGMGRAVVGLACLPPPLRLRVHGKYCLPPPLCSPGLACLPPPLRTLLPRRQVQMEWVQTPSRPSPRVASSLLESPRELRLCFDAGGCNTAAAAVSGWMHVGCCLGSQLQLSDSHCILAACQHRLLPSPVCMVFGEMRLRALDLKWVHFG
jgi:hypothetical protein